MSAADDIQGENINCDKIETQNVELCTVTFNSILMNLVSESDVRYIASMQFDLIITKDIDSSIVYRGETEPQVVRLINLDNPWDFVPADLIGSQWLDSAYSYVFSDDGKVTREYLADNSVERLDWTLTENKLEVGDTTFWLGPRNEAGASFFVGSDKEVGRGALVKRMPVSMTEADWVGRWYTYPESALTIAQDANADRTWRNGLRQNRQEAGFPLIAIARRQSSMRAGEWSVTS